MAEQANYTVKNAVDAVVGLQWGDEGKGKLVDLLAAERDAVVRYNGGANAGHSVVVGGERFALHLVPSGILYPGCAAIIGNGVVVDPETLLGELDGLAERGVDISGLVISSRAHVVLPTHKVEDELRETMLKSASGGSATVTELGTTRRGIGPCYADKVQRATAARMGDLLRPDLLRERVRLSCRIKQEMLRSFSADVPSFDADGICEALLATGERLGPCITDTTYLLHDLCAQGKRVLIEGANATLLDVDHGTFPYVTSSNASALGISAGCGLPPSRIGDVLGVFKAYSTRVGSGSFPTELHDATAERIRERGREFGTTTGRPRRVGWLDLVAVRYTAMINGCTSMALTMLDVLSGFDTLRVCTGYRIDGTATDRFLPDAHELDRVEPVYEELEGFGEPIEHVRTWDALPATARAYVERLESVVGVPISLISVGPDREQVIHREVGGAGLGIDSWGSAVE